MYYVYGGEEMKNKKNERKAVVAVEDLIDSNDYLISDINKDDKKPLWDGEIFVYSNEDGKNENIIGRVPVQVKFRAGKKLSYNISTSDLQVYKRDGGVMLYIVDENNNIYHRSLTPFVISKILSKLKRKNQKSVSIAIFKIMKELLYKIHFDFLSKRNRNSEVKVAIDKIPKGTNLKVNYFEDKNYDVFRYQEEYGLDFYFIDEYGNKIFVDVGELVARYAEIDNLNLQIGEKFKFQKVVSKLEKDKNTIKFGYGMKLELKKGEAPLFHFKQSNEVSSAIKGLKIFREFLTYKWICIGSEKIHFKPDKNFPKLRVIDEKINELNEIKNVLEFLKVNEELDLSSLTRDDKKAIQTLKRGLINNETVVSFKKKSEPLRVVIGNINLTIFFNATDEKRGRIVDIFDDPYKIFSEKEYKTDMYHRFEFLSKEDWCELSNINIREIKRSYNELINRDRDITGLTTVIINMISASDFCENQTKKRVLLDYAEELVEYLNSKVKDEVTLLNMLQIKKRKTQLDESDEECLLEIFNNNNSNIEYCFATQVLLGSKIQAKYYWRKFTDKQKEKYKELPIYNLYKELK